jgi:hypothetical protein
MLFQVWPAKSSFFAGGECIHFCLDVVVDHSPSLKAGREASELQTERADVRPLVAIARQQTNWTWIRSF